MNMYYGNAGQDLLWNVNEVAVAFPDYYSEL